MRVHVQKPKSSQGAEPRARKIGVAGTDAEHKADRAAEKSIAARPAPSGPDGRNSSPSARTLPASEQRHFESHLGYDFSQVRIHTDADADQMNRHLSSRAFTHGRDVYFAKGQYLPASEEGGRLLAHELSHVVQQRGQPALIQRQTAPPTTSTPTAAAKAGPKSDAKELAKLKATLVSTYSLAGVVDGSSTWTAPHLQQVIDALKLVPAKDRGTLKGVTLSRVTSLGPETAGQFGSLQSVTDTTVVNEATLKLADRAFKHGAPKSHFTIAHEVGHAVATLPTRTATQTEHVATAETNRLTDISNQALVDSNLAVDEMNKTVKPLNDAAKDFNAARRSGDKARIATAKATYEKRKKEYQAKRAATKAPKAATRKATKKTKAAKAAQTKKERATRRTAISKKDLDKIDKRATGAAGPHKKSLAAAGKSVSALSEDDKQESADYVAAIKAASSAIEEFSTQTKDQAMSEDDVETLIAGVQAKLDDRTRKRSALSAKNKSNPALAAHTSVERDQYILFDAAKAHSLAHNRNARVQKFVKFVESKGIAPITPYAMKNWPHKPEEFYAEAYSMYLTRPTELITATKLLNDWFKAKKY